MRIFVTVIFVYTFCSNYITSAFYSSESIKNGKITIFYETMCPDSANFITKKLYPVYDTIKKFFKIEFVPYGKAVKKKMFNTWIFNCQHGPLECWGNMVQACALAQYPQDPDQQMEFINCFMSMKPNENSVYQCSHFANMDYLKIKSCVNTEMGGEILARYGDITDSSLPLIKFVPSIVLNDRYDKHFDTKARRNLYKAIAEIYSLKQDMTLADRFGGDNFGLMTKGYRWPRQFYDIYGSLQQTMHHNGLPDNKNNLRFINTLF